MSKENEKRSDCASPDVDVSVMMHGVAPPKRDVFSGHFTGNSTTGMKQQEGRAKDPPASPPRQPIPSAFLVAAPPSTSAKIGTTTESDKADEDKATSMNPFSWEKYATDHDATLSPLPVVKGHDSKAESASEAAVASPVGTTSPKRKKRSTKKQTEQEHPLSDHSFTLAEDHIMLDQHKQQQQQQQSVAEAKPKRKKKHPKEQLRLSSAEADPNTKIAKKKRKGTKQSDVKVDTPTTSSSPLVVEPMQYDSSSSKGASRRTAKRSNKKAHKQQRRVAKEDQERLMKAPVPPGSFDGDEMEPSRRAPGELPIIGPVAARPGPEDDFLFPRQQQQRLGVHPGDNSIILLPPTSPKRSSPASSPRRSATASPSHVSPGRCALVSPSSFDAPSDESSLHVERSPKRKSFTKAVVAAAMSDATVHGRSFSNKDVRDRQAMSELSSDPMCSQYLRTMGQSFKSKPMDPPTAVKLDPPTPPHPVADPSSSSSNYFSVDPGQSPLLSHDSANNARLSSALARSNSRISSFMTARNLSSVDGSVKTGTHLNHHHQNVTVSLAAKGLLEETDVAHEMKYKISLMESLFDDIDIDKSTRNASTEKLPPSPGVDAGDDKVGVKKKRFKKQKIASPTVPPRDIDRDLSLIKEERVDNLEMGFADEITQGMTSGTSLSGIFNVEAYEGRRRLYWMILVSTVLVLGFGAAIIVSILRTRPTDDDVPALNTMAPTSFQSQVLPYYTQASLEFHTSPQSRAFYWLEHDDQRATMSADQALQRFVLATLFYATHGDRWGQSENWMAYPRHECFWYSHQFNVLCTTDKQYHTLSLPNNALKGQLPEEIELLSSINIVQLQNNQLSGTIPTRIWSSWKHLVFLNMYNNSLIGTIPPQIGRLSDASLLNTLSLRGNSLSGPLPSELGLLHVEFLSLSDNLLTGTLPTELGLLSDAVDLYLYDNHLRGTIPSTFGQLTKLTRLELHHTDLTGTVPQELCALISLGNLSTLTVDCGRVRCTCGCDCTATHNWFSPSTVFDEADGED